MLTDSTSVQKQNCSGLRNKPPLTKSHPNTQLQVLFKPLKARNERTRQRTELSMASSYASQSCLSEINLLNYSALQPRMRVGRATASSNNVLVVWDQQHPEQTPER